MTTMTIRTIGICGSGTMGSGIAQVAAAAGFDTVLYDVDEGAVARAKEKLENDLQGVVGKGKKKVEDRKALLGRIRFTARMDDCRAEVIIEAVVEKAAVKRDLVARLLQINGPGLILASNTSSLSISDLSEGLSQPAQ